jgi:hypothetical protein
VNVSNQKVLRDPSVLNCKEVSRIVASDELENLGMVKRLRTRFHLLICRECRRYAEQLRIIGAAARNKVRNLISDEESVTRLEKSILEDAFGASSEKH